MIALQKLLRLQSDYYKLLVQQVNLVQVVLHLVTHVSQEHIKNKQDKIHVINVQKVLPLMQQVPLLIQHVYNVHLVIFLMITVQVYVIFALQENIRILLDQLNAQISQQEHIQIFKVLLLYHLVFLAQKEHIQLPLDQHLVHYVQQEHIIN